MKSLKKYYFLSSEAIADKQQTIESRTITIVAQEDLNSDQYPIFTWKSSLVLVLYLYSDPKIIRRKHVLELGAGTAIPSVLSAKFGATKVYITERAGEDEMLNNIVDVMKLNKIDPTSFRVFGYNWGDRFDSSVIDHPIDVILGADVLYSSRDFDNLFLTIYMVMLDNPAAKFIMTYQQRR